MKLTFHEQHLSITTFDEVHIGDFTVLTGVNGSGKSHLLDAIHQKKALIDGSNALKIVKFNFETFKLANEGACNAHQLVSEREAAWGLFESHLRQNLRSQRTALQGRLPSLPTEPTDSAGTPFWEMADDSYRQTVKNLFAQKPLNKQQGIGIFQLLQTLPYSPDQITKEDFLDLYKPYTQVNDFLPNALGKVIWDYYVKYRENQVNEFENEKHGKNYPFKPEPEFIAAHGEKPWDLLNTILKRFETLDYEVNSPEGSRTHDNFTLKLLHTKIPSLEIDFSSLSSGERVMMALVASIYKASSDNYFPDVLLLDELDASLHPSMIKNMLSVIRDVFLARGIKVILVTHSPTTIALAPDEAVYVMLKYGRKRIEKSTKKEALSILTEGFATLEEGMMFFDEVTKHPVSILTEGNNARLIRKAIELLDIRGVAVVEGLEDVTGKDQLRTLFDFFSRVSHKNKVLFVWDCDVRYSLQEGQKTFPFILPRNEANTIATSGIENAFPPELFASFKTVITGSKGNVREQFDETRKKDFAHFIISRNDPADFAHFSTLRDKLLSLGASVLTLQQEA